MGAADDTVAPIDPGSPDKDVSLMQIFIGSTPYWGMLPIVMIAIANIPEIATWLPALAK
jgi:TRAP-type mannitol/chloroaromatic compound transport system permease large subunit